jgi:adenosylmethionine-8-amino-7-oxononanoate aminotransferase
MRTIEERFADVEHVGDIRGRGFFVGLELVADPETKQPFPAAAGLHLLIRQHALDNGLICYPTGGNVDGVNGDTVIIAPPFNVTDAEIDEIVDKLDRSVRAALADVTAGAAH